MLYIYSNNNINNNDNDESFNLPFQPLYASSLVFISVALC